MINESVMIATMGGQAQVVTFALDDLLSRGETVREVVVLHLAPENARVRQALEQLAAEFAQPRYTNIPWRAVVLRNDFRKLRDIQNEADATVAWQAVRKLVSALKAQGRRIHLCVAGGRRIIALSAMSAAMLHFEHNDKLWHLWTPREIREYARDGALMHTEAARLIEVPLMPWGEYFPALRSLAVDTPTALWAILQQVLNRDEWARCHRVWEQLTPKQQEALTKFAAGLTAQEVAEEMVITLSTVHSHKTVILAECRNAWELPETERLDYHFLAHKFAAFCAQLDDPCPR